MADPLAQSPGTVSKILWHFTGGPSWNAKEGRQNTRPKSAVRAYENLRGILQSRELRVGDYTEAIRVLIQERKYDATTRKHKVVRQVPVQLTGAPVCCLADIPIVHLAYHSYRYGKFAIGFHRDAVLRNAFNPVFYTLSSTRVIRSIYEALSQLGFIDFRDIEFAAWNIENEIDQSDSSDLDVSGFIWEIESEAKDIRESVENAKERFEQFLAFVKTFEREEFATIYCEREWRSLKTYHFSLDEVAMIVLPKQVNEREYFRPFTRKTAEDLGLPRSIPIVPWEDLIEN